MKFIPTIIENMFLIDLEKKVDHRGYFARSFCVTEFKQQGIMFEVNQSNFSKSQQKGTFRGLHYQHDGKEAKLIRCINGAIFDIVVDLRQDSLSYLKVSANQISDQEARMIFVPPGCAHGFLTLESNTEVNYNVSAPYSPELEKGIRYNDPLLKEVRWPIPIEVISKKDQELPDYIV